jgi:hypothetical protein
MPAYFSFEQTDPKGITHEFIFQVNDPTQIAEARAILKNSKATNIHVMGTVVQSTAPCNPNWSFHLSPDSISFFENAIEVCDANVTYVEKHLDEVGGSFLPHARWCPWTSALKRELTYP